MAKTKTVSHSEVDTYRQCRFKHQLAYKELWGTDDTAPALSRGTLFHAVLEAHYKKIKADRAAPPGSVSDWNLERLIEPVRELLYNTETGLQTEEQELVEWIYRGYLSCYLLDSDWEVVAVEYPLEEWLPTPKGTRSSFKLAGTVDLVVRDKSAGGGLWIVDHKTCKDLPKEKDLDLEDQTGIYTYLLKKKGADIRGAIYNHCRTYKLKTREMDFDERFKRTYTVRTDAELETMVMEVYDLMREAYGRSHTATGDAPRSPNGDTCRWKCNYTEACLIGRKGGDHREALSSMGFRVMEHKPGPTFDRLAAQKEGE